MERICQRENLWQALKRVKRNGGSPGIDGMTVDDLPGYLKQHWLEIREQLLSGTYHRNRYVGWKSRSRTEECENLAFLRCWIDDRAGSDAGSARQLG